MECPKCKKTITSSEDFESVKAVVSRPYIEVRTACECGQRFFTSLTVDDLMAEEE